MKRVAVCLAMAVCVGQAAWADQVFLKNGDRLTGTIRKLDGDSLHVDSPYGGSLKLQWSAVERIQADQPLHITLNDEQVVVGTVTPRGGVLEVETREAGRVRVNTGVIKSIRSSAEQAVLQAEIDRLRNPRLRDFWSGTLDSGLSTTRGNSETLTFTTGMSAARTTSRDKISAYITTLFAKNSAGGVSVTTAEAARGGVRFDLNLSQRTFAFGFTDLEYDKFQRLDLRNVIGGGVGYHVLKTERTAFDVFGGAAFNQEFFAEDPARPLLDVTRRSAELLVGEELSHKVSSSTALRQRFVLYPNLSESGEFRLGFDAGVVTQLAKWLGWQITVSNRYLSNPLPGIKKNDLLLTTGVRVLFGAGAF